MITMEGLARRLPLIARPRDPCPPLDRRTARLRLLADHATSSTAATVLNQATLLASDAGRPDLARLWCHRQAAAALRAPGTDVTDARRAVEPLVNLARLEARDGRGDRAHALIEGLYAGSLTGTDAGVDGTVVPGSRLAPIAAWLRTVLVGDGIRALAVAGRWPEVLDRLDRWDLPDSPARQQLTTAALIAAGRVDEALGTLGGTPPADHWDRTVRACLGLVARPLDDRASEVARQFGEIAPLAPLALFRTRLGLTLLQAAPAPPDGLLDRLATDAARADDAYSARELLDAGATDPALSPMVTAAGLGGGHVPAELDDIVELALRRLETA